MLLSSIFTFRFSIVLLTISTITARTAHTQPASNGLGLRAWDSVQIVALVDKMQSAWNKHDMHAFAGLFQTDAVFILWNAEVMNGRDSIEAGHARVHQSILRNSIRKEQIDEIRFVSDDVAVLRTYDNLTGDERYPTQTTESRKLFVCTKRDGLWRIGWGQTTRTPQFATKR